MHNQFSQILATLGKSQTPTPEPNAPTLAITTRSGITTCDPSYPNQPRSAPVVNNETAVEEEITAEKENPNTPNPKTHLSSTLYHPSKSSNVPFPSRLKKQKKDDEQEKFLSISKHINTNLTFLEALNQIPKGAKNALGDLGASINLMLHSFSLKLGISKLKPTRMSIQLADRSIKYPTATTRAVIDVNDRKLSLRVGEESVTFNIGESMKFTSSQDDCLYFVNHINKMVQEQWDDTLDHDSNWIDNEKEDKAEEVQAVSFYPRKEPIEPLEWRVLKNRLKPLMEELPKVELKALPKHLEYAFLQEDD
ncbi:hypothetical protein Tco_1082257 [Tanacetum coccineum]|uniref:Uncharacterized protein n=1 Tax=Tanacetum coccineum TaxID=301880 RepID=A0ABQ5I212_9ASTR